ncbi:3-isopropylmalate/(R)-2-methylmalate dehydratase small subunit [Microbacteriaceae bacterium SG_E_30_P1]|uniref:3-isopropylmalate dehydratase small subunit n=1 Tax=Antiquaquibacter oligotrophicus TaxID=2880260 RepID=A0ABT6KN99_9MICO|nr:3-isopropylmalate dehydratase small subunit [Antiquaquibacter oligotrophicus]MDH6181488.1 3-isopropylmalate/(R)-2-methylmalate dehydratase small subunit [Antiquaquibacter oligotrophicus]UDF12822.1 3-isopropylmalate dehydratase small subunit [Antiquaquibacter oligotrophicus]
MEPISTVTGIAVPLQRSNVDTDQIIPAQFLKRVTKTGFDDALFYQWRQDPDFVLNREPYGVAKPGTETRILVAGPDFGTGSSREHAVWALRDYGFAAVLSSRFGDIFRGNSGKQGLLAAQLSDADIETIWLIVDEHPGIEASVDLVAKTVTVGTASFPFEIDDYTRWRLLEGLDDIGLTLRDETHITEFESRRESWRPTTLPAKS